MPYTLTKTPYNYMEHWDPAPCGQSLMHAQYNMVYCGEQDNIMYVFFVSWY